MYRKLLLSMAGAAAMQAAVSTAHAETLQFYSSLTTDANTAFMEKILEKFPETDIEWVRAGGVGLFQRFVTERYAGAGNIDLLHFSYTPGWYLLADEGWVVEGVAEGGEADAFVDFAKDTDADFVALRVSTLRVVYNTENVSPEEVPTTWAELVSDKWKGRIVMNDPFESAGTWDFFWGSDDFGKPFIDGLFANDILMQRGMGGQVDAVVRGERDIAPVFEYLAVAAMERGAPLAFADLEEGVPVVPGPFGIIADAPNPELAEKVFEYLISQEGQTVMVDNVGTYSGRPDVAPPADLPPLADLKVMQSNWEKVYQEQDEYRDYMNEKIRSAR
ncbi:extracellular solute-binding protein [Acuticoccus sp. M5D2P5]|uniref:ABC transporter substrate-binding protein n=1 Tax=Acuticoccus kalidii TaxID=2910977 RepID=UPI001F1B960F|nr:extracellular solute-binding protein [Acuticoccus kalidii]MCF3936142.1 extracellular solute-binding protein [Acuticoccus kalidii]